MCMKEIIWNVPIDSRKFLAPGRQYSWVLVCRQERNVCFPQSNILLHIAPSPINTQLNYKINWNSSGILRNSWFISISVPLCNAEARSIEAASQSKDICIEVLPSENSDFKVFSIRTCAHRSFCFLMSGQIFVQYMHGIVDRSNQCNGRTEYAHRGGDGEER